MTACFEAQARRVRSGTLLLVQVDIWGDYASSGRKSQGHADAFSQTTSEPRCQVAPHCHLTHSANRRPKKKAPKGEPPLRAFSIRGLAVSTCHPSRRRVASEGLSPFPESPSRA